MKKLVGFSNSSLDQVLYHTIAIARQHRSSQLLINCLLKTITSHYEISAHWVGVKPPRIGMIIQDASSAIIVREKHSNANGTRLLKKDSNGPISSRVTCLSTSHLVNTRALAGLVFQVVVRVRVASVKRLQGNHISKAVLRLYTGSISVTCSIDNRIDSTYRRKGISISVQSYRRLMVRLPKRDCLHGPFYEVSACLKTLARRDGCSGLGFWQRHI